MNTEPLQLRFYTKPDCELCDKAKTVLDQIKHQLDFISIEEVDITLNLGLFTKYKLLIPVLEMNGKHLFVHQVNSKLLVRQLKWHHFWSRFDRS